MSKSAAQPPPAAPKPDTPKARIKKRLNVRALLVLGAVVILFIPGYFILQSWQDSQVKGRVLAQAKQYLDVKPPKPDLAIKYLDRYLTLADRDPEALALKAQLLTESARDPEALFSAIKFVDYAERNLPEGERRQQARRNLIELYLRKGGARDVRGMPMFGTQEVEYRTAAATARELLAQDAKTGREVAGDHRLLGQALLGVDAQGEPKALAEAAQELERAVKLDPADVAGAAQLAALAADRLKQPTRANAVLDTLLKTAPTTKTRLARVQHYARFGPPEKARQEMDDALKAFPQDADLLLTAANSALDRNEVGIARQYLDALPKDSQNDVRARLARGILEMREDRADEAIADWRQGLVLTSGNDLDLSFRLAWVLLQLGRVDEARPLMEQVRRLSGGDKPSALSRYLDALALLQTKQPASALGILEDLRTTLEKGQGNLLAPLCMTIARCYETARDEPKALEAYRAAAAAQPRLAEAHLSAARLMTSIAGPDAGAQELAEALKKIPDNPQILLGLARARLLKQRWVDADELLKRAEKVAPGAPGLIVLRADHLAGTGRLDEAVKLVGRAAQQVDRKNLALWLAYANGLARQGRFSDALQALERAAAPDAAGDRAAIRVARARLLQQAGRGRQARQELEREVSGLPPAERPELMKARVELLNLQGDRPAALAAMHQWSALAPEDPQPALALLDLALSTNDGPAAAAAIKALAAIHQGDGAYEFIGRAFEALRAAADPALAADARPARLDEADRLVGKVLALAPKLPQGYLMRGLILEERAKAREDQDHTKGQPDPARDELLDSAIATYRTALDNGGTAAVPRLIELLTRRHRPSDLAILRRRVASNSTFDRMSIDAALRFGLPNEAQEIARKIVEGAPEDLDARRVLADVLKRLGKPDEAEEALKELAGSHPGEPGPWLQLLVFQVGLNHKDAAKATLNQIVRNVKGERPTFVHAQAYWLAGDTEHAAQAFERALQTWPNDPAVARKAADFHEATGKPDQAEAILRATLKADPNASWASRKLALILSARVGNAEAWLEAEKLVAAPAASAAEQPEDRLAHAIVLSRSTDPATNAGAVPLLRSLKDDLPPNHPVGREARQRLTRYFLDADRSQEAWELAANAVDQDTDPSPDMVALHAEVLLATKRFDEAEAEARRLEALEPNGLRAEILRARLLAARGKPEEADVALEQTYDRRAQAPDAASAAAAVLTALVSMDRLDAAERVALKEAERRPADAWMLGRVLSRLKRPADALAACLTAVKAGSTRAATPVAMAMAIAPGADAATLDGVDNVLQEALKADLGSADLLMQRAQIRHMQGRFDDELDIYRDLQARYPADHAFLNNWAWTLSESLHKPEEALKLVQEAIQRSARYPVYLDTEGVILARLGRLPQALALLTEAAPGLNGGQGFLHLAEVQHRAGQDGPARLSLDRARAAGLKPEALDTEARARFEALDAALPAKAPDPAPSATPARDKPATSKPASAKAANRPQTKASP